LCYNFFICHFEAADAGRCPVGWEVRRGKSYYYRSRRVNGRVVKVYFGCGPEAEAAAREDAEAAMKRLRDAEEAAALSRQFAELFADLDTIDRCLNLLIAAEMIPAGYHKVRGQWRKMYKKRKKCGESCGE
jgi:hypothetical protein